MQHTSGQSLAEYAIIAGVVAVASIGTIVVSGNALATAGPGILDEIFGNGRGGSGGSNTSTSPNSGTTPPSVSDLSVSIPGSTPVTVTLASGAQIALPSYPTNLTQAVETAGANGTSKAILAAMEAAIQQLIDAGEIDTAQASLLTNLANKGHEIAEVQADVETMLSAPSGTMNIPGILQKAASFGTGDTFNNIPETFFTGSSESQFAVSQERASGSTSSDGESMIAKVTIPTLSAIQPGEAGAVLMADFVKLYQEAEASGVLSDPQLKQIVEGAALDLARVSQAAYASVTSSLRDTTYTEQFVALSETDIDLTLLKTQYSDRMADKITHYDSSAICTTGGDQDTGIHCG